MRGIKLLTCIQSTHLPATLVENLPISTIISCYDFTAIRPDTRENCLIRCTPFFPLSPSLAFLPSSVQTFQFYFYDLIWHIGASF
jgi:hypothetical protein